LKDQAGSGAENGIWIVTENGTGDNGSWDRATDFDENVEVTAGAFMFVEEGNVNADRGYVLTTNDPITIGGASGTVLAFARFTALSGDTITDKETPTGTPDGTVLLFTLAATPTSGSEHIYLNGLLQTTTVDYTMASGNIITFLANNEPLGGDLIRVSYRS